LKWTNHWASCHPTKITLKPRTSRSDQFPYIQLISLVFNYHDWCFLQGHRIKFCGSVCTVYTSLGQNLSNIWLSLFCSTLNYTLLQCCQLPYYCFIENYCQFPAPHKVCRSSYIATMANALYCKVCYWKGREKIWQYSRYTI
jgi:hypothetical protein